MINDQEKFKVIERQDHLRLLKQVVLSPSRYTQRWYFAYLLLGIVTSGMVPVLLPLMMMSVSHELSIVAYVMGTYNVGLMTSLVWGTLAERQKSYRKLFFISFLISVIAIAVFPFMHSLIGWIVMAFVLGAGSSGAATLASLFIVDFEPSNEWEPRIGMLQSFNGTGQVIGLLLAGVFSTGQFSIGLWIAAALLVPALMLSRLGLPAASDPPLGKISKDRAHHLLDMRALAVFPHVSHPSGFAFHFHALNVNGLRRLPEIIGTPFGRFLLSWFLLALGVAGFFTYFPLMLEHSFGVNTHYSSVIYAVVAGIGILMFVLASRWCSRFGPRRVYLLGLWIRLVGFALLLLPLIVPIGHTFALGATGFALIIIGWPILSVAGTSLAAHLSPFSQGEAMGLFNTALSSATVIGAFLSGPQLAAFGYRSIAIVGLVGIALAIMLSWRSDPPARPREGSSPGATTGA